MKLSDIKLPSNKKFGLFFSLIFLLLSIYFFFVNLYYFYSFSILLVFTFIISLIKPKLLKPFNYIWMFIGYSIGRIVNPIVMGMIFFLIFTPISLISKIQLIKIFKLLNFCLHSFLNFRFSVIFFRY